MQHWKPCNYEGVTYYDPRNELKARARRAELGHDTYVAVPIELAIACANLRECDATTVLTGDEDGPLNPPVTIRCSKPEMHLFTHSNGYVSWETS